MTWKSYHGTNPLLSYYLLLYQISYTIKVITYLNCTELSSLFKKGKSFFHSPTWYSFIKFWKSPFSCKKIVQNHLDHEFLFWWIKLSATSLATNNILPWTTYLPNQRKWKQYTLSDFMIHSSLHSNSVMETSTCVFRCRMTSWTFQWDLTL